MPSATPDQIDSDRNPTLAERLQAIGEPRFSVFEQQRRAGVPLPPPDAAKNLPPGATLLAMPEETPAVQLLPETVAATWLTTNVRSAEDVLFARIPAWGMEGVTTCILPKVVALEWPLIPYGPINKANASCLQVQDIRGKGKGCVAARSVARGELVARERALLVMPRTCVYPRHYVGAATDSMTPNERSAFFALNNCHSSDGDDLLGIISSNSFLIPGVPGHDVLYSAVFEKFSRLNHSCCPNAMFRWDDATFSGEIRALRPISEGEEVTISYFHDIMGPATVTHERRKFLIECYDFKCGCAVCGRPSQVRSRNDEDRVTISKSVDNIDKYYQEMVRDWVKNGGSDHARLLNYLHAVEKALNQEMIFHPAYWIYLARAIVMTRCALREAKAARKWARRAAQHTRAATGSDGGWDEIAREPEKCEWWGAWNKPRLRGIWV